jgi:hypothetical protein
VLRVSARVGAIWQVGDELEARDERLVVLGELIGKLTLVVRSREWENALVLGRHITCLVERELVVVSRSGLVDVAAVIEAVGANEARELRRVNSWVSSTKGTGSRSKAGGRLGRMVGHGERMATEC